MENQEYIKKINELKKQKNAVIVAHYYQVDEVQEIADVVGDSFALSKYCAENKSDIIVFCGVKFMAESAKILAPYKTVLLPEIDAGCPMADMITPEELIGFKKEHPNAKVVCYVNSSAEVKALSDVCCTSSNAVNIVRSIKEKDIIFIPDKNLGSYVQEKVPEKNIILWDGYCITHHKIREDEVQKIKEIHPDAQVLVHPECSKEVRKHADYIGSTKGIIDFATKSDVNKFIIGTEMGVMYQLKKNNPQKQFYLLSQGFICSNMKKTTLKSVYNALANMCTIINIEENIIMLAKKSLDKMLEVY